MSSKEWLGLSQSIWLFGTSPSQAEEQSPNPSNGANLTQDQETSLKSTNWSNFHTFTRLAIRTIETRQANLWVKQSWPAGHLTISPYLQAASPWEIKEPVSWLGICRKALCCYPGFAQNVSHEKAAAILQMVVQWQFGAKLTGLFALHPTHQQFRAVIWGPWSAPSAYDRIRRAICKAGYRTKYCTNVLFNFSPFPLI